MSQENKEQKEIKTRNTVEITGFAKNVPDYCKYIPRPLISFDLDCYRRRKTVEEEWITDEQRIIVFDNEEIHKLIQDGDRVKIIGELQSRNYTRDNHEVDELLAMAVKNYVAIWDDYPTFKKPKGNVRQIVNWGELLKYDLIPHVPEDSMYDEDGNKDRDAQFVYRMDEDGNLYKETQHTAYEIVASSVEKIEEELHETKGDYNKVILQGPITRQPYFDYLGQEKKIAFCGFNISTKSELLEGKMFYNNVITWADLAESTFHDVTIGDYVRVVGRLQSRNFEKEMTKKWKTPSGKKKKKKKVLTLMTREVSATKVTKLKV